MTGGRPDCRFVFTCRGAEVPAGCMSRRGTAGDRFVLSIEDRENIARRIERRGALVVDAYLLTSVEEFRRRVNRAWAPWRSMSFTHRWLGVLAGRRSRWGKAGGRCVPPTAVQEF